MQTVVDDGYFEQTVTVEVREAEEMHGGIVHTHHQLELLCLGWVEHVAMEWGCGTEDTLAEVEIVARQVIVEVGVEA